AALGDTGAERDTRVLAATAGEFERALPFSLWAEALDDAARELPPDAELAGVLPSVDGPPPLADERYRAHRAVRRMLERLAPAVVVADGLAWAGRAAGRAGSALPH